MRPYFAIIKDSFREALASRVLWVFTGVIVLLLIALAPLGYQHNLTTAFAWGDIVDPQQFAKRLKEDGNKEQPSPGKRIWSLLDANAKKKIDVLTVARDDEKRRERDGRAVVAGIGALRNGLNEIIKRRDFFEPALWSVAALPKEAKDLLDRGPDKLSQIELARMNRLLIEAAFPNDVRWRSNDSISIAYLGFASDPLPFSKRQVDSFIKEWVLTSAMDWIVGVFGLIAALLVTSNVIPQMFEPGSITLLLSKPVSRSLLFTSKFVGACAFVFLNVTLLIVGLWLIVGVRFDIWNHGMLACIPVFLFMFLVYYAVSALTGLVWKSAIISVVVTVLFWIVCFVVDFTHGLMDGGYIDQLRITQMAMAGDTLIAINEQGVVQVWDDEEQEWRAANEPRGGPIVQVFDGPYYQADSKQLVLGQSWRALFGPSRQQRISLKVASAEGAWRLQDGPALPSGTAKVLMGNDGTLYAIAGDNIYAYHGDLASKGMALRFFGTRVPLGGRGDFQPCLAGERLSFADPIAAALDPAGPRMVVCAANEIYVFAQQDDGSYKEAAHRTLDIKDKEGSAVAIAGDLIVVAFENGKLLELSADDLSTKEELKLEPNSQPRFVDASNDGQQLGVVYQNRYLWLIDAQSGAARRAPVSRQGEISGISFVGDQLLVGDQANRVVAYDANDYSRERTYQPAMTRSELAYYYGVGPLYKIFPKPRQLHKTVQYLVTGKRTTDVGLFQGDLTQHREDLQPWQPVRSGLAFLCVVLVAACVYMERQEF
jgi:ABC-type transport system involved in multi-copper enzyme maturation permease subunit